MSDPLDNIENVHSGGGGNFFDTGLFRVLVTGIRRQRSRKGDDLIFVDCEVKASSNGNFMPGSTASWCLNLTRQDSAVGDFKLFVAIASSAKLGEHVDESEVKSEDAKLATSDAQPLAGIELKLECWTKPQKGDPSKSFTKHTWSVLPSADWMPAKAA